MTNIKSSYKTSAAANPQKTKKAGPPDAAAEFSDLKNTFAGIDEKLVFDEAFYHKVLAFLSANRLDSGYLSWLYELCLAKKPQNIAGYYYRVFFEQRFPELYRAVLKSRPPPPDRPVQCPVCGAGHKANEDCPQCRLPAQYLRDPEKVERHKQFYAIPPERRAAYEAEREALIRERAKIGFEAYFRRVKDLKRKFNLSDTS